MPVSRAQLVRVVQLGFAATILFAVRDVLRAAAFTQLWRRCFGGAASPPVAPSELLPRGEGTLTALAAGLGGKAASESDASGSTAAPSPADVIRWPSDDFDDFKAACEAAVERACCIEVAPDTVIQMPVGLELRKNGQILRIYGAPGCRIEGAGHSVFTMCGRRSLLELRDIAVHHVAVSQRGDGHDVGATLFLMGDSKAELHNVEVSTIYGLGIWMVQRAKMSATNCSIVKVGRSGVAMFGDAKANLTSCFVSSCAIHGTCARGRTRLQLEACRFEGCGRRSVYVYQNGTLQMTNCEVRSTQDPTRAAVEAAGARPGDNVNARISNCTISGNAGAGVKLRGAVKYALEKNVCEGSGVADLLSMRGEDNQAVPVAKSKPTGTYAVVREFLEQAASSDPPDGSSGLLANDADAVSDA
eukprot:TRINITY_DN16819_c0_g1_i1.p1 TRINITY_DN16819_c0_g1~~TRINITY_DN16819_c0_g1_i1.p1  ORF type:complete len:416 (+),score=77.45 TRINITY_DN16819_c0_g1_i1:123-1370(+)